MLSIHQINALSNLFIKYGVGPEEAWKLASAANEYDRSYTWRMHFEENKAEIYKTIKEIMERNSYDSSRESIGA